MNLIFKFNNTQETSVSFLKVFKGYYEWFKENNPSIEIILDDVSNLKNVYAGSNDSGYFLTITNPITKKYIVVSYWDKSYDLKSKSCGWSYDKCVDLICSCGIRDDIKYTPFTYIFNNKDFYNIIDEVDIPFNKKEDLDLLFRGNLYGYREELQKISPKNITDTIINPKDYLLEISKRKISLSLNGAAEICHRDIEIMSTGSVLLRPELTVKFHNKLIPWVHYIPFKFNPNYSPKKQWEIIKDTFNGVRNDEKLLTEISDNSLKWFKQNGTISSNIELLKKLINIKNIL